MRIKGKYSCGTHEMKMPHKGITPTLQNNVEGPSKKSCNDDMILFVLHMNEDLTFSDFRKTAGRPLSRAVRCRYKTFFAAPSALFRDFYATSRITREVE
jgi:hypothetical protein